MRRQPLLLASILCIAASQTQAAISLSGTVTDSAGHPLQGAGISLAVAGNATSTGAFGAWSISVVTTRISPRASSATTITRHLVLDGGRIRLQFAGVNGAGRTSLSVAGARRASPLPTPGNAAAARATDAGTVDTLLFAWNGRVRVRVPIASITAGDLGVQRIDTVQTSDDIPWNDANAYGTLTDARDGQVYQTVKIGAQTWMAQNLNFKVDSSICLYGASYCSVYGRWYKWSSAMGLNDTCNTSVCSTQVRMGHHDICPTGWHIPSNAEWKKLTDTTLTASSAGTILKSMAGWAWGPGNGTDSVGFRALPAGSSPDGYMTNCAFFWSASEFDNIYAWRLYLDVGYANVYNVYKYKTNDFSVRCLAD